MLDKSCGNCQHLTYDYSNSTYYGDYEPWAECEARPSNSYLIQFPFRKTTCKLWEMEVKQDANTERSKG